MNCKTVLRNAAGKTQAGFALPIAIGMGLVLVVIGIAMILRSQNDRIVATAQKTTARSLSAAETGIGRFQTLFSQYRSIGRYPACSSWSGDVCGDAGTTKSWATAGSWPISEAPDLACGSPDGRTLVPQAATRTWKAIDAGDTAKGQYRLFDYTYDPSSQQGTLIVEGRVNPSGTSTAGASTTRLMVNIPISTASQSNGVPAVWFENPSVTMGTDKVKGNLFVSGCSLPPGGPTVDNLSDPNLFNVVAIPKAFPGVKPPPGTPVPKSLGSNPWKELPEDVVNDPKKDNRYQYSVSQLDGSTGQELTVTPGEKVDLYVQNNIQLLGDAALNPEGDPTQLRIFGSSDTRTINFDSTGRVNAFILAPGATVSVTNNADCPAPTCTPPTVGGSVRGSLWVKDWNVVNGGTIKVDAFGSYQDYEQFSAQRDSVAATTRWEPKQVTP
jgi:Tfp pilus assembly protein PilX